MLPLIVSHRVLFTRPQSWTDTDDSGLVRSVVSVDGSRLYRRSKIGSTTGREADLVFENGSKGITSYSR